MRDVCNVPFSERGLLLIDPQGTAGLFQAEDKLVIGGEHILRDLRSAGLGRPEQSHVVRAQLPVLDQHERPGIGAFRVDGAHRVFPCL